MRTHDGQIPLSREEIADFHVEGQRQPLMDRMRGIWRPAGWESTLSVLTKFTPPDQTPPYNDEVGGDGLVRYAWMGDDGTHANNVGLRNAMAAHVPIIWFVGVSGSPAPRYNAVCPVYVVGEEWDAKRFILMPVTMDDAPPVEIGSALEHGFRELEKRYIRRSVKQRLHQPRFRSEVLLAYENHCAICNLAHSELLDAAHIVPDRDEGGIAQVKNGMAMCKIHHAAFDGYFLGIRPGTAGSGNLRVEIRQDLLDEVDGPMLRHGLQELNGRDLMKIPRQRAARPDRELLEQAYEAFRAASVEDADPGLLGDA